MCKAENPQVASSFSEDRAHLSDSGLHCIEAIPSDAHLLLVLALDRQRRALEISPRGHYGDLRGTEYR